MMCSTLCTPELFPECTLALTKLIFHGHYDLHLVQTVQTQVFHEVGGRLQLGDANGADIKMQFETETDYLRPELKTRQQLF